jgi:hypothetical protein
MHKKCSDSKELNSSNQIVLHFQRERLSTNRRKWKLCWFGTYEWMPILVDASETIEDDYTTFEI